MCSLVRTSKDLGGRPPLASRCISLTWLFFHGGTVLVDERADGVHLSYDRMASFLAPYGNRDALEVARNLDRKVEDLLRQPAA